MTAEVAGRCLCFRTQRAARTLARRFDAVFRPFDLTNGQFSLLMSLHRPLAPGMSDVAPFLGMDRSTLTAALKPLERRGLVEVRVDKTDRRGRRLHLTETGLALLERTYPVWRAEHDRLDDALRALDEAVDPDGLRVGVDALGRT
ncbi:MAG: MarR family transcriptional regulator [Pseudomonadota bacterium]